MISSQTPVQSLRPLPTPRRPPDVCRPPKMNASVEVSVRIRALNEREREELGPDGRPTLPSPLRVPPLQPTSSALLRSHVLQVHTVERSVLVPGSTTNTASPMSSPRSARPTAKPRPKTSATTSEGHAFQFDNVFWSVKEMRDASGLAAVGQREVYESIGQPLVEHAFSGFNSCLFAYGQTGSGKTYTMMGPDVMSLEEQCEEAGIIPRVCEDIFRRKAEAERDGSTTWSVELGYVEVYNERVSDLLARRKKGREDEDVFVEVRENPAKGVYLDGQKFVAVESVSEVLQVLEKGNELRHTASTKMNNRSSRSHAILMITLKEQRLMTSVNDDGTTTALRTAGVSSRMNLVDLAGSERVSQSEVEGMQFSEATHINLSLTTLGRVIDILADMKNNKTQYIPFRESKLTHILKESLKGNSKTFMVATVSPSLLHISETVSTLRYASRAREIVNVVEVNEDPRARIIRELEAERQQMQLVLQNTANPAEVTQLERKVEELEAERQRQFQELSQLQAQRESWSAQEAHHKLQLQTIHQQMTELNAKTAEYEQRAVEVERVTELFWRQRVAEAEAAAAEREERLKRQLLERQEKRVADLLEWRLRTDQEKAEREKAERQLEVALQERWTLQAEMDRLRAQHTEERQRQTSAVEQLQKMRDTERETYKTAQESWAAEREALHREISVQGTQLSGQLHAARLAWKVEEERLKQEKLRCEQRSRQAVQQAQKERDHLAVRVSALETELCACDTESEAQKLLHLQEIQTHRISSRQEGRERSERVEQLQTECATLRAELNRLEDTSSRIDVLNAELHLRHVEKLVMQEKVARLQLEGTLALELRELHRRQFKYLVAHLFSDKRELEARLQFWRKRPSPPAMEVTFSERSRMRLEQPDRRSGAVLLTFPATPSHTQRSELPRPPSSQHAHPPNSVETSSHGGLVSLSPGDINTRNNPKAFSPLSPHKAERYHSANVPLDSGGALWPSGSQTTLVSPTLTSTRWTSAEEMLGN